MNDVIASFEYFRIIRMPKPKKRKTHVYGIYKTTGIRLGEIRWYGAWRQFCFFPATTSTVWSLGCLVDVQSVLEKLNKKEIQ
jgi:hypothetical protein